VFTLTKRVCCAAGIALVVWLVSDARAQTSADNAAVVQELVRQNAQLREELETLKSRVSQLEGERAQAEGKATPAETSSTPPAENTLPTSADAHSPDLPGSQGVHFRAFASAAFEASDQKGEKGSFRPASMSLLMTDALSDQWHALAEINFEANDKFETVVDVERLQLSFAANENFNLTFGRFHSALSYFNTAFHHGRWLETVTDRPLIVEFPDDGGLLPQHKTGVAAAGLVPHSGAAGLHYFAEFGANPDFGNNANAVAAGLFVRPPALPGWQAGFSYQHSRRSLATLAHRVDENIYGAHLVFRNSQWEFMNEAFLLAHGVLGERAFHTPGFYSLVSREFGNWRPFFLYQYVNAGDLDPIYSGINRVNGASLGFRYDLGEHAAFKTEYFRVYHRHEDPANKISLHVDWVF